MLKKYIRKTPGKKLKIQMTDTSFIRNKYGIDKVKRNKYAKNTYKYKIFII